MNLFDRENISMDELRLNLSNCYGIQKMNIAIDYTNNNVAIIYAPNGTINHHWQRHLKR